MSTQDEILKRSQHVLIENYGRLPFVAAKGAGALLYDGTGREYIDFFPGFGAGGVAGHCHPRIVSAIQQQAETLLAHGNLFTNLSQVELAERITANAFGGKVFYCHSGAEADEAALKLVRLAAGEGRYKIISFDGCFHGRTMGGLSLTPESFQKGFEPMLPGNAKATFGDLASVEALIDEETAGVFVEPIQGEGGMNIPTVEFMQGLRALCDRHNLLLVVDEVWTAPARTGKWFAYQHYSIDPDVMTLAKAIGGGVPVGVMVAGPKWQDVLTPGTHGCTMGGNPLCAAAGAEAMKMIEEEQLLDRANALGSQIQQTLCDANIGYCKDVRGKGLMIGIGLEDSVSAKEVMLACMEAGLIVCLAKNNVLRLAPPLTIEESFLHKGMEILLKVLRR